MSSKKLTLQEIRALAAEKQALNLKVNSEVRAAELRNRHQRKPNQEKKASISTTEESIVMEDADSINKSNLCSNICKLLILCAIMFLVSYLIASMYLK